MDLSFLLLAQGVETVEQGLSVLEKINAGGVPLICLVIAALCGLAFYWQLKANKTLNEEALAEAKSRETAEADKTTARLAEQESFLREMLTRDKEGTEATSAAIQTIEGYAAALKEQQLAFETMRAAFDQGARDIRDLRDRIGVLEDAIRRFRDA